MNVFVADMRRTATAMRLCFADGQATINRYLPFGRDDRVADFIARHNLVAITDTGIYNHVRNQETYFLFWTDPLLTVFFFSAIWSYK